MNRAAHFESVKGLIGAPLAVHDSGAPLDANQQVIRASYVVLFDMGIDDPPDDQRFTAEQAFDSAVTVRILARSVGVTPFAARSVDDAVCRALIGKTAAVVGRACDPITLDATDPVKRDTAVSPPLFLIESEFVFRSYPA